MLGLQARMNDVIQNGPGNMLTLRASSSRNPAKARGAKRTARQGQIEEPGSRSHSHQSYNGTYSDILVRMSCQELK